MPLIQSAQDHLPYIDHNPNPESLVSARALITASLPENHKETPHPSLPPAYAATFSPLIETAHMALSTSTSPSPGIDLSRYEAPSLPTTSSAQTADYESALRAAYTSSSYLTSRLTHLSLLEQFGKNAWLVSNAQLEDLLRDLERDVGARKAELESLQSARRGAQEGRRGEMRLLEEEWRRGVGRLIEVQSAGEGVRREILQRRRAADGG